LELRENYGFPLRTLRKIQALLADQISTCATDGERYMVTRSEFERANARGSERRRNSAHAVFAKFDKQQHKVVVELSTGLTISFHPRDAQGLENARPADLKEIEISPSGLGLYFPRLDVDLYIPGLLDGFFGSRRWAAAQLGARGGKATSVAKTEAARANGLLGGRPRKRHRELV
jgi:hypothetical protein